MESRAQLRVIFCGRTECVVGVEVLCSKGGLHAAPKDDEQKPHEHHSKCQQAPANICKQLAHALNFNVLPNYCPRFWRLPHADQVSARRAIRVKQVQFRTSVVRVCLWRARVVKEPNVVVQSLDGELEVQLPRYKQPVSGQGGHRCCKPIR